MARQTTTAERTKTETDTSHLDDKLKDFQAKMVGNEGKELILTDTVTINNPNNGMRYKIINDLPNGGEGKSYLAEDAAGERKVVKILNVPSEYTASQLEEKLRLLYLQVNAALDSDNHVFTLDDEQVAVVSDYVEGRNLKEELSYRNRIFKEEEVIDFLIDILENDLTKLHRQKLVHRDVKPQNVICHHGDEKESSYKLIDFGIMRDDNTSMTMTVSQRGSISYTKIKEKYECSDDFYSLARTAYFLLKGKDPGVVMFAEEEKEKEFDEEQFKELKVSESLKEILIKMLGHDVNDRYVSCEEIVDELRNMSEPEKHIPSDEAPAETIEQPEAAKKKSYSTNGYLAGMLFGSGLLVLGYCLLPTEVVEQRDLVIQTEMIVDSNHVDFEQVVYSEDALTGEKYSFVNNEWLKRDFLDDLAGLNHKARVTTVKNSSLLLSGDRKATEFGFLPQEHSFTATTSDGRTVEITYECATSDETSDHTHLKKQHEWFPEQFKEKIGRETLDHLKKTTYTGKIWAENHAEISGGIYEVDIKKIKLPEK